MPLYCARMNMWSMIIIDRKSAKYKLLCPFDNRLGHVDMDSVARKLNTLFYDLVQFLMN